jgi:hypothetical protein
MVVSWAQRLNLYNRGKNKAALNTINFFRGSNGDYSVQSMAMHLESQTFQDHNKMGHYFLGTSLPFLV